MMSKYLFKNTQRFQIPVELTTNPSLSEIVVIPPKAMKKVKCTEEQAAFATAKYKKEMVVTPMVI